MKTERKKKMEKVRNKRERTMTVYYTAIKGGLC